jgi:hypothetical protein
MDSNIYQVEEYKHIYTAIIEGEKQILQIFGGTIVVAVSLLSAVTGLILGRAGSQVTTMLAYAALAPNLLVIPSFYLLLSQRIALMRMGSYRRVFFEEQNEIRGWETRLGRFRNLKNTESNDPISYSFWAVFCASAVLFGHGIFVSGTPSRHLFILVLFLFNLLTSGTCFGAFPVRPFG